MRAILATVGTRGDVQPMLALAVALRRLGHEAVLACPASFGEWVVRHGVEHRELGEDLQARLADASTAPEQSIRGMTAYFTEQMAKQAPALLEIATGADVILSTGMAWMAASVAEKLTIPVLGVLPSTAAIRSRLHPPPLMPWFGLPTWINGLLWWTYERSTNRLMGGPVNAARASLGLSPIEAFGDHLFVDTPNVIAADDVVLPPDPAWAGRYPYVGALFLDDPAPLDPELDAFLERGEPPVFVGFGSMAGEAPERVRGLIADTTRITGRRFVVLGGAGLFERDAAPEGVFPLREAPFAKLFPRLAVAVHHGGAGTVATALRAGIPQVVLPMMLDQHHHAHGLLRAGLAPAAPTMKKVTAEKLAHAIEAALALPSEPRQAAAARCAERDAASAVIARLEQLRAPPTQ